MTVLSHQQLAQTASILSVEKERSLPVLTHGHSIALDRLGRAFTEAQPLTILIGEGKSGASYLIDRFLAGIEGNVAVVRISEPCTDAIASMREVIQAIGFEPTDLSLTDLENVFTMFLSFQKSHHRRTVFCMEEAQDNGWWALDGVRRLVELETEGKFGLMVILSGRPSLNDLLNEPPLDAICAQAQQRIALAPFTLAETREYIRWRIESAGTADIAQVFEFDAITRIHELCEGVADAVSNLCSRCLQLSDEESTAPVTTDLVRKADIQLRLPCIMQQSDAEAESMQVELKLNAQDNGSVPPRIILTRNGKTMREMTMEQPRLMIGRSEDNDLQINGNFVSRHHALFIRHGAVALVMDLNSTNGTYVNDRRIQDQIVIHQDIISIGNHRIKFIDPNARVRTTLEGTGFGDTGMSESLEDRCNVFAGENTQALPVPQEFKKSVGESD